MCIKIGVFVVVICVFAGYTFADTSFWDEVQQQCIQRCPLQNRTDAHSECGYDCKIEQCTQGCKLWNYALESSCRTVCNGTQEIIPPKELYCLMGCNYAMTRYFALIRERIGTPPAPALVADSLTATSLSLKWDFSEAQYAGVRYLVQWRYEEISDEWQYCRNRTWGSQDTIFVDNLQPYTKYRFRVALLLSHHDGELIVSDPSVVISTLASGTPASAPAIVRAVPVDWSRISVSWEPGPFPHGPVLSYVLRITENHLHGYSALKDIPASKLNYMFQNLLPSCNYTVTVSMRNGVGEGPASTILVSTPDEPEVKDIRKPILILGAHHTVIQQGADMLDELIVLYKTKELIKGLAIHVRKQLLFISDSAGYIYKTALKPKANKTVILSSLNLKFLPLDLSIDWLNDQLYILGEVSHTSKNKMWQITRCGLDGSGLTVAVAGLMTKPHHIEVDPYNGYLFWVLDGSSRPGLYRLDLADISNGVKHEIRPDIILERPHLGAFTVDHTKFRLLVPNHNNNTVYSVSFDGLDVDNIRSNTQQPMFHNVLSLATANRLFYWTNGDEVLVEEYHPGQDSYFHNAYPDLSGRSYMSVVVNLPSCQPIPVPINPPTAVQAILGSALAKTSWQVPHLLGGQGKGAWKNWSYEINIKDIQHSKTITLKGINSTSYTITDLKENTNYVIKTAAYTSSGTGPWSSEFHGKTLKRPVDERYPSIIWSASEGVLTSDVTGENVQTLLHKGNMKDYFISDIAWYQDQLYLVSNTSHMYWYNMTTHQQGTLIDIDSVGSVAVDWIGRKLYWSNPKQQLIIKGNLNGSQQQPLPILTVAKELNVDSLNAYIYWSTGHAVECARLNGEDRLVYHPAQPFTGKQVMGLTLDMEQETVYWIVRSYEGSTLYRENMVQHLPFGTNPSPQKVTNLQKPNMQGPLSYFSGHLLWLQDDKNAVIADMNGQNAAVINGLSLSGLAMVSVFDPLLHKWPNSYKETELLNVIPDPILNGSVKVHGTWNSFNITWLPTNVDYSKLFYEVKISDVSKKDTTRITTDSYIKYWKPVPPFTHLDVTIRAYSYWGTAPSVHINLNSPASTPTSPKNARCFVSFQRHPLTDNDVSIIFRWDVPQPSNGEINGYIVSIWYKENSEDVHIYQDTLVHPNHLQYVAQNLTMNEVYYFQVQAYTDIGNGNYSEVIQCNTSEEVPVPILLTASTESIYIQDFDTHKSYSIFCNSPVCNTHESKDITYMLNERKMFWLHEVQTMRDELFMGDINKKNKTKLVSISGKARSLTVDWVERCLYLVLNEANDIGGSSIYKLDLNKDIKELELVLTTHHTIISIQVSPFTRNLYWMEINQNQKNVIMQANTDGTNIKYFFERNRHFFKRVKNNEYLPCNCPDHESIAQIFTIDHSSVTDKPEIIFIDTVSQEVIVANKHGCDCNTIVAKSLIKDSFPMKSLTVDRNKLYWTNNTNNFVYALSRQNYAITKEKMVSIKFLPYGSHMQPFPPAKCLMPRQTSQQVGFQSKTAESITLSMPTILRHDGCADISIATIEYSVYYMPYSEGDILECDDTCTQQVTFDKNLTITGLRPFSKYMFSVAIKNYYSNLEGTGEEIGPAVVFQTAAGAPTKSQNVTVIDLNPTMVEVRWLPPDELNGKSVSYEIHWQTQSTMHGVRRKGEQTVFEERNATESSDNTIDRSNVKFKSVIIQNLHPNQTYLIWVRAHSENNETFSDSNTIEIKTYPEPSDILLLNSTAYSLIINWQMSSNIENCVIQYTDIISNQWIDIHNGTKNDVISVTGLRPMMKYKFQLLLKYDKYPEPYVWPSDTRFMFETLGDRPTPPGTPIIGHVRDVYQISWEASRDNGAKIQMYNLEGVALLNYRSKRNTNRTAWYHNAPYIEEQDYDWISYYNGTDTYWVISDMNPEYRYTFRVTAFNRFGWSDASEASSEFILNSAAMVADKPDQIGMILGIAVPLLSTICVCVIFCFIYLIRRKKRLKKAAQLNTTNHLNQGSVELANLPHLPHPQPQFVNNVLYSQTDPITDELALLPQISCTQIKLGKELGRGAFGKVVEGIVLKFGPDGTDLRVAVKQIYKEANEKERREFLHEGHLMSQFKHEHIVQLIGICLDYHLIIIELMEGGDLLNYLRNHREPKDPNDALTIMDLMSMCVDVAKGCCYLEDMHFVHRDLACRNCLVSSTDRALRIVKISDFGLARDIYKNDYYKLVGQCKMPVRWMAPESMADGVFTSQSDVWAFGVLLWEIMTLGQQPYPARDNDAVWMYVKFGGQLDTPVYATPELYELMKKCWSFSPKDRPLFRNCLEDLEQLKRSMTDGPLTAAHSHNSINEEPHNDCAAESNRDDQVPLVQSPRTSNGHIPHHPPPVEIPKYLEILDNSISPTISNDYFGYEVPRSSMRSTKSARSDDRSRTISTSSTISNGSAASLHQRAIVNDLCNKNGVQKTIVQNLKASDKLLATGNVHIENCISLTTQPLLGRDENCSVQTRINNLT